MYFSISLLGLSAWALLSVSSVAQDSNSGVELMGCPAGPTEEILAIADQLRQEEIENAFDKTVQQDVTVDTYFHVLAASEDEMKEITVRAPSSGRTILLKRHITKLPSLDEIGPSPSKTDQCPE